MLGESYATSRAAGVPPDELAFYDALKTPPDFCLISTPWR